MKIPGNLSLLPGWIRSARGGPEGDGDQEVYRGREKFRGTWMTESGSLVYRVIPKCGCSTIGQVMYYSDHGEFFDGDIHDAQSGLIKWEFEQAQATIVSNVLSGSAYAFTCVRNPYGRILSCFFDKICAIQRDGRRYRQGQTTKLIYDYGVEVGGPSGHEDFDQIRSFRRFLLFARDTIRWRQPIGPDLHWSRMSDTLATFIRNGGTYGSIIWLEHLEEGLRDILAQREASQVFGLNSIPRFNESQEHGPKRRHAIGEYFDDMSMHLVREIYGRDFELFRYDPDDPTNALPVGEIDMDEVHAQLGRCPTG